MAGRELVPDYKTDRTSVVRLTMSASSGDKAAHSHHWSTLEESLGDNGIRLGDSLTSAGDGEDTVVNTLNDLGDTGLDASLIAKVGNVLASLSNDDTSLLGGDNGTEGQLSLSVLLVGLWGRLSIWTKTFSVGTDTDVQAVHVVGNVIASLHRGGVSALAGLFWRSRHVDM